MPNVEQAREVDQTSCTSSNSGRAGVGTSLSWTAEEGVDSFDHLFGLVVIGIRDRR